MQGGELAIINKAHAELAELDALDDVLDIRDKAEALRAYIRASHKGLQAQNAAAALKLRAERRAGELLAQTDWPINQHAGGGDTVSLADLGVSNKESSRWQKLARVPADIFETYLANTTAAGKEITQKQALSLLATPPRPERPNIAAEYSAPPIDVEIAQELGLDASDQLAELIVSSIENALHDMKNPRQAFVWAKYHGINDDGTLGDSWTYEGIAQTMGTTREYVESLYYRASHHVRGRIAADAYNQLRILLG